MERNGQYYSCPVCGKQVYRTPGQLKRTKVVYCSRECFKAVNGLRMTELNRELNPTRMTQTTKQKIREQRLKETENRVGYPKVYGRHEHRIVAEQMLGRPLNHGEVVHHIDRNKQNNKPENLMVFSSQAEHAKWHKEHDKGGDAE